jgi:uncharacterized protein DUF6602
MLRKAVIAAIRHMNEMYVLSGGVDHDGEKGAFREYFVSELLRPLLPTHFGVGSGVVVDADERQSKQTDVLIYDRRRIPPILQTGERGLFPIDSVLVAIEVKSTLKPDQYSKQIVPAARCFSPNDERSNPAGLHIRTCGRLNEPGHARPVSLYPTFAVLAYTSDADRDEAERLRQQVPLGFEYVHLIGVFDKGVWLLDRSIPEQPKHTKAQAVGEEIGLEFLALLLSELERIARSRGDYQVAPWLRA